MVVVIPILEYIKMMAQMFIAFYGPLEVMHDYEAEQAPHFMSCTYLTTGTTFLVCRDSNLRTFKNDRSDLYCFFKTH